MDTFSIGVIHSNQFIHTVPYVKRQLLRELKIFRNSIAFAHPKRAIFSDDTHSALERLDFSKTISSSQFFRKPNSVGSSFPEKTIMMERAKMYVSLDEVYRMSLRQPLCVFTLERSNSGTATWIEMLASKTRSSGKSRCRSSCQGKTMWQRLNVRLSLARKFGDGYRQKRWGRDKIVWAKLHEYKKRSFI